MYDTNATFCSVDRDPLELDQVSDPLIGREIQGRFRIDQRLGAGGMGAIYSGAQSS